MKTFFLLFGLIAGSVSYAQTVESLLASAMLNMEKDDQFKHAIISLYIVDSKTGKVVFDKNSEIGLAPASCLKVLTSAAALELLGKDYRYKSEFGYSGKIENDTLKGSLIFTGFGDPTLGSFRWDATATDLVLKRIIDALKRLNIKVITGDLVSDESKWTKQVTPGGWTWEDIGNYYGAGARGFNWHENQYDLFLKPGSKIGDPVEIVSSKPVLHASMNLQELKTDAAGSGDNSIIYLAEDHFIGYIKGTIPAGKNNFKISGSIPDAAMSFSYDLREELKNSRIEVMGRNKSNLSNEKLNLEMPKVENIFLKVVSPPLDSINYWFLQKSVNLYGEAFVKTIAFEKTGFGATETGIDIIKDFWNKSGIEKSALNIKDGSGLSPANRVTTDVLVAVMQYAKEQSWYSAFYDGLPEQNGIKMKSGYIGGVRGYTGYVRSKSGTEYTFSFLINNFDGSPGAVREKMWQMLDILK